MSIDPHAAPRRRPPSRCPPPWPAAPSSSPSIAGPGSFRPPWSGTARRCASRRRSRSCRTSTTRSSSPAPSASSSGRRTSSSSRPASASAAGSRRPTRPGCSSRCSSGCARAQIVARGPKARGAIQQAGLAADWVAESETAAELEEFLLAEGVRGKRIAVQHHGSGSDGLDEAFEAAGADVVSLTVYRWGPPPGPGSRAAVGRSRRGRRVRRDPVHVRTRGRRSGSPPPTSCGRFPDILEHADSGRLLMAAVGPDHRRAAASTPASTRSFRIAAGSARSFARSSRTSAAGTLRASRRRWAASSCAAAAPCSAAASSRSRAPGWTCCRCSPTPADARSRGEELLEALPRSVANPHAVEVAIARVREALDAPELIKTVVKRGYRLNVVPETSPIVRR